jgi:hypothetical protein
MGLFALGLLWFYTWVPASSPRHWTTGGPEGFYNELADAFLAGRTSLLRSPDPRMAALADPYDPAQNAPFRVNDLSYFEGRYYLYMGPAPALTVFIPAKLLTGRYVTERTACSLLCLVGALASIALVSGLRRHWLPGAPAAVLVAAAFALALADGYYAAGRGTIAQQVAIANAYAFGMLALWACGRAVAPARHPAAWFALASLCMGTAVASRPNYVFACAALAPPLLFWLRSEPARRPSQLWGALSACAVPLGIVVSLLLIYNRVRFGHFLEFGQRYQLGNWNQLKLASSGLGHGWENAWRYLVAPARYSRYFPFVSAPTWIAVSVLPHVPWLWLSPLAAWAAFRKGAPAAVRALAASALLLAVTNLLTLIFLPSGNPAAVLTSANGRYLLDFQPALALFVALGVLAACAPGALPVRRVRWVVAPLAGSLALASIAVALSLDIGCFAPESYRPLARVLDLPAYALERVNGTSFGMLDMSLSFPVGRTGAFEPVVSTGIAGAADLLYASYVSPTQLRFGLVGTDLRGPESEPVTVDYGAPHRLRISMGSLYPPAGHPLWRGLGDAQVAFLERRVRVELDGRVVIDAPAHFNPASPADVMLGRNPFLPGYSQAAFSGRIAACARLAIAAPPVSASPDAAYGEVRLRLVLPSPAPTGIREPLLVSGVPRAGDIVYIHYLGGGGIRLGIDHWGTPGMESKPIRIPVGAEHTVQVAMGALFPSASNGPPQQRLRVLLDGAAVIDADQDTYASSPYDVIVGTNAIGGSTCAYAFTGRILKVERVPPPP